MGTPPLANLAAWYEADSGVTLAGSSVTAWADKTSNHNDLSAIGGYTDATFASNQLNGLPAITFANSGYNLTSTINLFTTGTVFAVFKLTSLAAKSSLFSGPTNSLVYWFNNASALQGADKCNIAQLGKGSASPDTSWHQSNVNYNGSGLQFRLDRANDGSLQAAPTLSANQTVVGYNDGANGEHATLQLAALLVYTSSLSAHDVATVENYLNTKYFVAAGSPSIVQTTPVTNVSGVGTFTCAFGSNVGAGNTILFFFAFDANDLTPNTAPAAANITDTRGNTYSRIFLENNSGVNLAGVVVYAANNPSGGADTISFDNTTGANTGARGGCVGLEYTGLQAVATMVDQSVFAQATSGTSLTTPGATTTQATEILVAFCCAIGAGASTFVAGTGYTIEVQGATAVSGSLAVEDKNVVSTGTYTAAISGITSGSFITLALLTLKAALPTHSISGSAGAAGATMTYSGAASGTVTSDSLGNYSIGGLADGSYTITPSLSGGYTFTPSSANETVSGANITGVNFTITTPDAYTLVAHDTFHQADGPLNPANWTVVPFGGLQALETVSNLATQSSAAECADWWTGVIWGSTYQYVQVTLNTAADLLAIFANAQTNLTGPQVEILGGTNQLRLDATDLTVLGTVTLGGAFQTGDVVRLENSAGLLRMFYNGVLLLYVNDSPGPTNGGKPTLDLAALVPSDIKVSDFQAGIINGVLPPQTVGGQEFDFGLDFMF